MQLMEQSVGSKGLVMILLVVLVPLWKLITALQYRRTLQRFGCYPVARYPHKDPILGYDLYRIIERSRQRNEALPTLQWLFDTYGNGKTFQALTWGVPTVFSADPRMIRAVLKEGFHNFGVEPFRKPFNKPWIRRGLLVSDGQEWKMSRAILRPLFQKSQHADLPGFEVHVQRLIALIPKDEATFDLQPLLCRLSLDWATEYLFGESSESLLPQARMNVAQFSEAVEKSLKGVTRRVMLGPVLSLLPKDQAWHAAFTEVNQLFERHIDLALAEGKIHSDSSQRPSSDGPTSDKPFVLLQELVKESQDREFLRDQLVSIFLPTFQALPIGLADVFFQVARVPRVWKKLRAEALELGDTQLTFEVLKSMRYLQCVLKESLRLLAPLDRIVRLCVRSCVLPHGGGASGEEPVFVQRGTLVDLRNNILHRDTKFWGADANDFRPERWLDSDLQPRWEYLPFGGGMRNCPAHQMTVTQFAYIVTRFVREFETLENRDPTLEFVDEYTFSKRSRNGVKIALVRART